LKLYYEYSRNYWKALAVLDAQIERSSSLLPFIEKQKSPTTMGQGKTYLQNLLMVPIQVSVHIYVANWEDRKR
jgi:hypothetical protein